jgi:hypothetical protein
MKSKEARKITFPSTSNTCPSFFLLCVVVTCTRGLRNAPAHLLFFLPFITVNVRLGREGCSRGQQSTTCGPRTCKLLWAGANTSRVLVGAEKKEERTKYVRFFSLLLFSALLYFLNHLPSLFSPPPPSVAHNHARMKQTTSKKAIRRCTRGGGGRREVREGMIE